MKYLGIVLFFVVLTSPLYPSGLDLTPLYGSRQMYLGGSQISESKDAYASYYNPAALMGIEPYSTEIALNSVTAILQREAPVGGASQQKKSTTEIAPLFFFGGAHKFNDFIAAGFAIYPTALQGAKYTGVDYNDLLTDREFSNQLVRVEFAPSIAFRIVENLSLGASYRFGYTQYKKKTGVFLPSPNGVYADTSVDRWDGKGLKFGAFLDNWNGLSAGITYRLKTSIVLKGKTLLDNGTTVSPAPTSQNVSIPAQLQTGLSYEWIPGKFLTAFSYEYTFNNVLKYDETNIQGLPTSLTQQPVRHKNGHSLHFGGEYTGSFSNGNIFRIGSGIVFDNATTRQSLPSPLIAPSNHYIGYNVGGQYEVDKHIFGLALNYGSYSHTSTELDASLIPATVFTGKYKLTSLLISADYQVRF